MRILLSRQNLHEYTMRQGKGTEVSPRTPVYLVPGAQIIPPNVASAVNKTKVIGSEWGVRNGGGSVLAVGLQTGIDIPYAVKLSGWFLEADVSGSIVIDVWRIPFDLSDSIAAANSITNAGNIPTLTSQKHARNTNFPLQINANDFLVFNIDSC